MGDCHAEQPKLREVGIAITLMIRTVAATAATGAFAQNTSQTHPDPTVQTRKRRPPTVFEILKPAANRPVYVHDDRLHALAIRPFRLAPDRVPEFRQTLLSREPTMLDETVTKEFEALFVHMDDFRLGRMQRQTTLRGPLSHHDQGRFGFVPS